MLILNRKRDESIMIGDDVEITLVAIRRDKRAEKEDMARLGITAPRNVPVHRREIYDAIQREKAQKTEGQPTEAVPSELPPQTGVESYFRCAGAYGSNITRRDAYIAVSQSRGRRLVCYSLDRNGYCSLAEGSPLNKCPHNLEKLV